MERDAPRVKAEPGKQMADEHVFGRRQAGKPMKELVEMSQYFEMFSPEDDTVHFHQNAVSSNTVTVPVQAE